MSDDQQKDRLKTNDLEASKDLKAIAKALMVNLTWTMAGLSKEGHSDSKNPPPHRNNQEN